MAEQLKEALIQRGEVQRCIARMSQLPQEGFVRLPQIIGKPRADPPIPPVIPVGKTTWWEGVKTGRFPKPEYPFGPRIACWRVEAIRALLNEEPP